MPSERQNGGIVRANTSTSQHKSPKRQWSKKEDDAAAILSSIPGGRTSPKPARKSARKASTAVVKKKMTKTHMNAIAVGKRKAASLRNQDRLRSLHIAPWEQPKDYAKPGADYDSKIFKRGRTGMEPVKGAKGVYDLLVKSRHPIQVSGQALPRGACLGHYEKDNKEYIRRVGTKRQVMNKRRKNGQFSAYSVNQNPWNPLTSDEIKKNKRNRWVSERRKQAAEDAVQKWRSRNRAELRRMYKDKELPEGITPDNAFQWNMPSEFARIRREKKEPLKLDAYREIKEKARKEKARKRRGKPKGGKIRGKPEEVGETKVIYNKAIGW